MENDGSKTEKEMTDKTNRVELLQLEKNLDAELAELRNTRKEYPPMKVLTDCLHRYNDIKDATQMVLGAIARINDTTVATLQKEYDLPNDRGLEWFNVSEALSITKHLRGKIVVLDFFTYCCINCMHILPDLDALETKFSIESGLVVIGVHSAKFSNERDSKNVLAAIRRYNIQHPVVNDATLSMWHNIGIMCWPTVLILGPSAQPLAVLLGEGHKEELFLYAKTALDYFTKLNEISNHTLPIIPSLHLESSLKTDLHFPGKIVHSSTTKGNKLIIADSGNNRILIMNARGEIEDIVGGHSSGFKDGNFDDARFNAPQGICLLNEMIYVADTDNHAIRKIDLVKKHVNTVAGIGKQSYDYVGGKTNGDQMLSSPWDLAVYYQDFDESTVPVLLIAMAGSHQIWALFLEDTVWWKKTYKANTCVAIVGNGREGNRNNSYPHAATLAQPSGITVVQEYKAAFIADSESSSIRRINLEDGKVSAVCGASNNPENLHDFGDVDGARHNAKLQHPLGLTWDPLDKELYVADTYNHKIKKVNVAGHCKTLYGGGKPNDNFLFNEPAGLAIDRNTDSLYIADTNNHAIKKIDLKKNSVCTITPNFLKEKGDNDQIDNAYKYETVVNSNGGELKLTFEIIFEDGSKLNDVAPQKWSVVLPTTEWSAKALNGLLKDPVSIKVPAATNVQELRLALDVVACRSSECIAKRLQVIFNVSSRQAAPSTVVEHKKLLVKL